jgi:hypothetical protein
MLAGAWHLIDWQITEGGRTTRPFGAGATGLILYTPDGHMSATIAAAGRRPFGTGNPRTAAPGEQAAALASFFHYAGTYEVAPGPPPRVTHRVTHALNPGFVGTEQVREIVLDGDRLILSATEALPGGASRHHRIDWRR